VFRQWFLGSSSSSSENNDEKLHSQASLTATDTNTERSGRHGNGVMATGFYAEGHGKTAPPRDSEASIMSSPLLGLR
jgi:hypothetical protein